MIIFLIRFYASKSKKIKKILNIEYKKAENLEETIKTVLLYLVKQYINNNLNLFVYFKQKRKK